MKKLLTSMMAMLSAGVLLTQPIAACTGVYVGKDLTEDGSVIFGRTEDLEQSHNKTFVVVEATENEEGAKLVDEYTKFEFELPAESYKYFAVPDTTPEWGLYYEAGYNEYGVAMDATTTTYTNDEVLAVDPLVENGLSEGIMTTVVLGHVKTAREGVELLASIIDEKGSSEGNGLIIADKNETWYMEILSGHQYAAMKLPDDMFAVFPNSFFLETVDVEDTENVIASADLIKTAEEAGTYVEEEGMIRVADSYAAEIDPGSISRYWSGVKTLDPDAEVSLDDTEFPFLHSTDKTITLDDVMSLQRNRLEDTDYIPADNIASATGGQVVKETETTEGEEAEVTEGEETEASESEEAEATEGEESEEAEATEGEETEVAESEEAEATEGEETEVTESEEAEATESEEAEATEGEECEEAEVTEGEETETTEKQEPEKPENALYPIGNKNTMEAHIFQIYEDMPEQVPGVMWLAMGSPTVSPYLPYFGNINDTISAYQVETNEYDPDSFYWAVDNLLTIMLEDEENLKPEIREKILAIEKAGKDKYEELRQELITMYAEDPQAAAEWITEQTMQLAQDAFDQIKDLEAEYVEK
ncbi:Peptidase family C69 [Facklamia miroungae]|uniref:Dipeptidase n=1 Tax=Facklamia miroungae TaxID=120956 RepID=A0A1G7RW27_9LACT|nr:C69 family dipeptidase [Facklamia miroungae]SDG15005.1 Peptidase family C69 [Facklamia miroungae]